jgi:ribosome biogenesis GTPase / thiamine phosphate phosphatase
MTFEALGWSGQRQRDFAARAADGLIPGRVVGEHRTHFRVATDAVELSAEMTGRLRNAAVQRSDLPGVGDFVALRLAGGDGPATIEEVLPRTSALVRKASSEDRPQLLAANVDVVFIVTAPDGDLNLPRIERLLALVADSAAAPVIVLNKADLTDDVDAAMEQIKTVSPGVPIHAVSAHAHRLSGIERHFADNRTVGLIGSSGVGKSTLTNALLGRAAQATQEVRAHDSRGRHTTTHRQLFLRPGGGSIIDTPGMRGVDVWNRNNEADINFADVEALALNCKFSNCRHEAEPKCAVRAAVARGDLDAERVAGYTRRAREAMSSAR